MSDYQNGLQNAVAQAQSNAANSGRVAYSPGYQGPSNATGPARSLDGVALELKVLCDHAADVAKAATALADRLGGPVPSSGAATGGEPNTGSVVDGFLATASRLRAALNEAHESVARAFQSVG